MATIPHIKFKKTDAKIVSPTNHRIGRRNKQKYKTFENVKLFSGHFGEI